MVGEHGDFIKLQNNNMRSFDKVRDRIICDDDFSFSCQASHTNYCSPRVSDLKAEEYESWEIGFLSSEDDLIKQYLDGGNDESWTSDCVYGYVPTHLVVRLIEKHGGIKKSSFPQIFFKK